MAVTIDGTSGINTPGVVNTAAETIATTLAVTGVTTFAAGTAALPAITTTGDTNTGIFFPAADTIGFSEGGVEAMRITSTGDVGIGTASPSLRLHVSGSSTYVAGVEGSSTFALMGFKASGTTGTMADPNVAIGATGDALYLRAGGAERARIDSSGNLLVGTTATASYMDGRIIASATSVNPALTVKSFDATQFCSSMWVAATTGTNIFANFLTETTATIRGSITYNRGGGLVAYNTTSDYRAKTVNGSVQNALAKVALLKPSTGRMNGATEDIDFFVAHELQEVVSSAVTGEKDAVNEDSTPKYQMVDKSALIPLLTAAIQEQQALITALTTRITALEAA